MPAIGLMGDERDVFRRHVPFWIPFRRTSSSSSISPAASASCVSINYLKIEDIHRGEYYALMLFATTGMMMMASAGDLITLYLGLELMALSIYVLAGFMRTDSRSNEAAIKYLVLGAFSSGIMLYGMSLLYGLTGDHETYGHPRFLQGADLHESRSSSWP